MAKKDNIVRKEIKKLNYCIDLSLLSVKEFAKILSLYDDFNKIFIGKFTFSPLYTDSKIFYIALNHFELNYNYIGYSHQEPAIIKLKDPNATFVTYQQMENFLIEYLKKYKVNRYSKNIKITLELIKHK